MGGAEAAVIVAALGLTAGAVYLATRKDDDAADAGPCGPIAAAGDKVGGYGVAAGPLCGVASWLKGKLTKPGDITKLARCSKDAVERDAAAFTQKFRTNKAHADMVIERCIKYAPGLDKGRCIANGGLGYANVLRTPVQFKAFQSLIWKNCRAAAGFLPEG